MIAGACCPLLRPTPSLIAFRCQSSPPVPPPSKPDPGGEEHVGLQIGSAVVLVAAPPALKTAAPMPSLKVNTGQIKAGDVRRIASRRPKDVWAVRLAIGTYLIDGKDFKPLDLENHSKEEAQ